jgi:hypothetical protein
MIVVVGSPLVTKLDKILQQFIEFNLDPNEYMNSLSCLLQSKC